MILGAWIEAFGFGAVVMYMLDPDRGTRRRALVRDQIIHQAKAKRRAINVMVRDFGNRANGAKHRLQSGLRHAEASDQIVEERVRAALGRCVSHSGAIQVKCERGAVDLSGMILASEVDECLSHVMNVAGVKSVANNLEIHANGEHISALQGGCGPVVNNRWTPATCLLMGFTGTIISMLGVSKRGISGGAMMVVGAGMVAKAFHDTEHRFDPSHKKLGETKAVSGPESKTNEKPKPEPVGGQPVTTLVKGFQ